MNAALKTLWSVVLLLLVGTQLALAARTTTYFHTDGLGSVVAASDQSGALLWRKSYAPFGEQIDTQSDNEKLSYTGKPHDDVTGLTYFGGRYYDPAIGRFASVDPVGFVESNPMSFNRYLYVNNNPYKYVDPDGEFLNFAAKFVLDVGVNIAFNYATTGSFGVGSALKESATGILNPAKTVAKVGKLAKVLSTSSKLQRGPGKVLIDSNTVTALRKDPTLGGRLGAGEQPVVSYVTRPELREAVSRGGGLRGVPRALDDLEVDTQRPSIDTIINIRGALLKKQGRFGDGIIGAQAVQSGRPLVTNDKELANVVRAAGGTVR